LGCGQERNLQSAYEIKKFRRHKVKLVAAGMSHSVAVTSDGTLYTWGSDLEGQTVTTESDTVFFSVMLLVCMSRDTNQQVLNWYRLRFVIFIMKLSV
jgi:alpha-tubulin suppressor-like RCC1 family protein